MYDTYMIRPVVLWYLVLYVLYVRTFDRSTVDTKLML